MDQPSLVEDLKKTWMALILIVCGLACLCYFVYEYSAFKTIKDWSQTQGTIQETFVGYYERRASYRRSRGYVKIYIPRLHYSYVVEGRKYESDQLILGGNLEFRDMFDARAIVKQHPEGSAVTVYYHPKDPQRAILFPRELGDDVWISLVMGLILVGFNSLIVYRHSAWLQYQLNYVPPQPVKEQPTFMRRRLSRRERKQRRPKQS